uniref:Uncharacterized sensor-like histidine kinase ycf26 n=1 Tax=Thorea hispida TaxID=202687 RepID=A0A1Z1XAR8_9FLOR|nr:hypothetical protein [Thorea hispida]
MIYVIWLFILVIFGSSMLVVYLYIQHLTIAFDYVASGNFHISVKLPLLGKLGDLILSFNNMVQKLKTLERKNQEHLIAEQSKLETFVSILTEAAILLDENLRIVFFNQAAIKTFKYFNNCIIGVPIFDYLPYDLNNKLIHILNKMVNESSSNSIRVYTQKTFTIFDRKIEKTLRFKLTTILDRHRKILIGIAIIVQDITYEVKNSEAGRAQFIGHVSHELRTPLFNIQSFLETLLEYNHILTNKQKIEFLTIANRETTRLSYLVNDILDLSRLESDSQYPTDYVDLETVVRSVIQASQIVAFNQKIQLIFQRELKAFITKGSYNLLVQVLSNLISNAIKFTPIDGRVVLKVYLITGNSISNRLVNKYNKVRIEIIDEGTGIGEFDQSRIFDRFFRVDNEVRSLDGTGLGLSIVKKIIERHSSHIYLYSELDIGSSFWFDLFLYS